MIRLFIDNYRATSVFRAFKRTRRRTRVITAQTLNRQARQARTRLTRIVGADAGISPLRLVRNRILISRSGRATPRRLEAVWLALFAYVPVHWFKQGPPAGADIVPTASGRRVADVSELAYRGRDEVMRGLSGEWAPEVNRRLRVELRRIWGGVASRAIRRA